VAGFGVVLDLAQRLVPRIQTDLAIAGVMRPEASAKARPLITRSASRVVVMRICAETNKGCQVEGR
jgi:hypothetical protein